MHVKRNHGRLCTFIPALDDFANANLHNEGPLPASMLAKKAHAEALGKQSAGMREERRAPVAAGIKLLPILQCSDIVYLHRIYRLI